jgi:23S rRNA (uridine2552-2'-O)-methyltransferase
MTDYKKPDYWQLKARQEGYPARSVYKLIEIDEKFRLFKQRAGRPFTVLDLGASPGSWSLYILRRAVERAQFPLAMVAADISPLSREFDRGLFDSDNFCFIQGDITDPAVSDSIISKGPYDVIVSDAAPLTTGNRFIDTVRSLELAEAVTAYAESALSSPGSLIVKVFQGGDTSELLRRLRTLFKTAKSYKPQACRRESFETYYVGLEQRILKGKKV